MLAINQAGPRIWDWSDKPNLQGSDWLCVQQGDLTSDAAKSLENEMCEDPQQRRLTKVTLDLGAKENEWQGHR